MTAIPKDPEVSELREMFRHLTMLRVYFETDGIDEMTSTRGNVWSLWDLEYLYQSTSLLRQSQRMAIQLCLIEGMLERDAARLMRVGTNNPVGMYATLGLRRLLDLIESGALPRFHRVEDQRTAVIKRAADRKTYIDNLAAFLRSKVSVDRQTGCWLFPCRPGSPPMVMVRSHESSNGFLTLDARRVLFEYERGPMIPHTKLVHTTPLQTCCIKVEHMLLAQVDKTFFYDLGVSPVLNPRSIAKMRMVP